MHIAEWYGAEMADLSEGNYLRDLRERYRAYLERQGVQFPDATLELTAKQWEAWQTMRHDGVPMLEPDGSPVDLTGFDQKAASTMLDANRSVTSNANRLKTLVSLGHIAKAGALALAACTQTEAGGGAVAQAHREMTQNFKRFVQAAIGIEEWDRPWQDLVAADFAGGNLRFPLTVGQIPEVDRLFSDKPFLKVRDEYFNRLSRFRTAIHKGLGANIMSKLLVPDSQIVLAARVGTHWRTSAESARQVLKNLIEHDHMRRDVDWEAELNTAVARAARFLGK